MRHSCAIKGKGKDKHGQPVNGLVLAEQDKVCEAGKGLSPRPGHNDSTH